MDVNNTKFHLLLGRADWGNCKSASGDEFSNEQDWELLRDIWQRQSEGETNSGQQFKWNEDTSEISLQSRLFKFTASPKDVKPDLINRRGAARDRYGNWYWIDETGLKIKTLSAGSNTVSDYYPVAADSCAPQTQSGFQPVEQSAPQTPSALHGLAVTIDHYLVVGTIEPQGLLVFDLFSVGEPRRILWRDDVDFVPFDIATRRSGGVFVLDRTNHRYWTLNRGFYAVGAEDLEPETESDDFQPLDNLVKRKHSKDVAPENVYSQLPVDEDPISIEALPDDSVLILNLPQDEDFSVIYRYYYGQKLDEMTTASIKSEVQEDEDDLLASPPKTFRLRGYDIAFVDAQDGETHDRLYIVTEEGNQAFAFRLVCKDELPASPAPDLPPYVVAKNFELQPIVEYFPMRLFGGKGFTSAFGKVYFDFGERWLPLVKQKRPLFVTNGALITQIFDGKETNCIWHRLMIDGCISAETKVEIYSRAAASKSDLDQASWQAEPKLYLRGNGSEQPFVSSVVSKEKGKGTWELLFQRAKGRYMQLKLVFSGNGQRTPRISAMRLYYPRFSYLDNYLPSIYREDEQSAFFVDRFLANFEGFYTVTEDKIAAVQMLFDVRSAPPDALEWLASWFGVALDPAWKDEKRRLFIRHAVEFFQYRGTVRGLRIALRLALDSCADESLFDTKTSEEKVRDPIRIVEKFLTRRTPEIIPADYVEQQNLPRLTEETSRWTPNQGADVLHQRYQEKFEDKTVKKFPLIKPTDAEEAVIWESFALETLGFVPSTAAASERQNWQSFLRAKYLNEIEDLNEAHDTNYEDFDEITLPHGTETSADFLIDWQDFLVQVTDSSRNRKLWQDFLARRYRRIGQLNNLYGTKWSSFESISLYDELPNVIKALGDWVQFESGVLPMHETAHRFTVLIPATLSGEKPETPEEQNRKLELVRRLVDLEKPAHTICDFRYYWNLFRLEEVRLGTDTLLGLGSRDPLLNPALVIGEGYVGESRLGEPQPERYASRYVLGSENLIKTKKG
jgi:phage tail-like protein